MRVRVWLLVAWPLLAVGNPPAGGMSVEGVEGGGIGVEGGEGVHAE